MPSFNFRIKHQLVLLFTHFSACQFALRERNEFFSINTSAGSPEEVWFLIWGKPLVQICKHIYINDLMWPFWILISTPLSSMSHDVLTRTTRISSVYYSIVYSLSSICSQSFVNSVLQSSSNIVHKNRWTLFVASNLWSLKSTASRKTTILKCDD